MSLERLHNGVDIAGIEFGVPLISPLLAERADWSPYFGRHCAEGLFDVVAIEDLNGIREEVSGQVPDPGGAVSQDAAPLGCGKAAPAGFAQHALSKLGGAEVGLAAGRALSMAAE